MPLKERYKINVIPCNTNTMSRISAPKSKTVEDIVPIKKEDHQALRTTFTIKRTGTDEPIQEQTMRNLEMIALKTKALNRKLKKIRSKPTLNRPH